RKIAEEKNGGKPIKVVANLPYYITTPLIMGFFTREFPLNSIQLMVRKKVHPLLQSCPVTQNYVAFPLSFKY
ncbi:16S rRNA (adenine(1518)-N(6)/adenine(1519)-N(6))-dimethyltransferase, partial [Anaerobutyricum hallii]|uniref:rRNA adenine N-6-methyltransferase family protein n=1 Tax=Anaerobutyricum hallii TaxID=39488 RepID=UPI0024762E1E